MRASTRRKRKILYRRTSKIRWTIDN